MEVKTMNRWFIKVAALYFLLGNLVGMFMSSKHNFDFAPFHAHINLLGWVSLALFGLIYTVFPKAGDTKLATWHFWIYNIFLLVMMVGLFSVLAGNSAMESVIAIGATGVVVGVLLFVINLFCNIKKSD
jgi:cbb3-type cytochrome oxidase subunit 1